jgi:hypothetical protein
MPGGTYGDVGAIWYFHNDEHIPHRTEMSQLISTWFQVEYQKMIHEIQVRSIIRCLLGSDRVSECSRPVSFTDDVWSRGNLHSHFAIKVHYTVRDANGNLVLKTRLVAFRRMEGSHTGGNISNVLYRS